MTIDRKSNQFSPTRRQFLQASLAAGCGATVVLNRPLWAQDIGDPGSAVSPVGTPSVLHQLTAAIDQLDVGNGQLSWGYSYNGLFPGPVFEAWRGETVAVRFLNALDQPTTVHWHGMVVPHAVDGHPIDALYPGQSFIYRFPIVQRAALTWYHPHPHGLTGEQVNLGLAGAFILRDQEEAALDLPLAPHEVPLIIRDAKFDSNGNFRYNPPASGFFGDTPLVNGKQNATLPIDAEVYRFRILNGANARVFRLALHDGSAFTLIGNDGGLLEFPVTVSEIELSPGERLDLLVDFRGRPIGSTIRLVDLDENWDLIEFNVTRDDPPQYSLPGPNDRLSTIDPLVNPQFVREFTFDGHSRINGESYDTNRIDFEVPFAETELWRFVTGGNGPHPVHVHGASFQVVSRSGGRNMLFPWESGWKDTVLVADGETVEVLVRFDVYDDQLYLMHCHQLEHEDAGMMSNFRVLPRP